jgi:glycerate dehydrogenase
MRIVVLDGHTLNPGDNPWDEIAALGDLVVHERTPREIVVERCAGAEIVVTNKALIDAATMAALPRLRFIAVTATGYNVVDVAAAAARGIAVSNVPEYGTDAVAQHTIALLLELAHGVGEHDAAVHAGEWARCPDFSFWHRPPLELAGLTLGIVGFGRIGRRVAELARAFGMRVIAAQSEGAASTTGASSDPRAESEASAVERCRVGELFAAADVVSLHCPLTAANARFVNRALLARMKPTALLLNTARGGLVDEADLAEALAAGRLAGAAVDVAAEEPISPENPLLRAPRCLITPHLAWATLAARRRLMSATAANVRAFLAGAPVNLVRG